MKFSADRSNGDRHTFAMPIAKRAVPLSPSHAHRIYLIGHGHYLSGLNWPLLAITGHYWPLLAITGLFSMTRLA